MSSHSEVALQALFDAIVDASEAEDTVLPAPRRNEALPARVAQGGSGLFVWLDVWDGSGRAVGELLGADAIIAADEDAKPYDIEHRALIDFSVTGGTESDRRERFDACLKAIAVALRPAVVDGALQYLGGAVDNCAIEEVARDGSGIVTEGLPNALGASITVLLTFTSSDPF
jgi:hypothetical protein